MQSQLQQAQPLRHWLTQAEVLVVDAYIVGRVGAARGLGGHAAGPFARAQALVRTQVDLAAKADMAAWDKEEKRGWL